MSFWIGDRQDALVDEGPDRLLGQPLLVGELEVHYSANAGRPSIEAALRSRT